MICEQKIARKDGIRSFACSYYCFAEMAFDLQQLGRPIESEISLKLINSTVYYWGVKKDP